MNKKTKFSASIFLASLALTLFMTGSALAKSGFLSTFNSLYGTSSTKLNDCTTCHGTSGYSSFNPFGRDYRTEYLNNGKNVTNALRAVEPLDSDGDSFGNLDEITARTLPGDGSDFPAVTPTCTDADNDGYALEGGDCGPIDCNDSNPAINPTAVENCTDGLDNNCNGLVDTKDPAAANCPMVCTDQDGDGYAVEGGECGPIDCNDKDLAVHPGAVENCSDTTDNDCDGLIDCVDGDCSGTPACDNVCIPEAKQEKGKKCSDGLDNDCDGVMDAADPDCVHGGGGPKGGGKKAR